MIKFALYLVLFALAFASCKKKNKDSGAKMFSFNSLTCDKDTIKMGNVTNIKVDVSGSATFSWSASAGEVFGSGGNVVFGSSSCCTGKHTITCLIKDEHNNSESHSLDIQVNQ